MTQRGGLVDGTIFPDIQAQVAEMTTTYHRRREAGRKLAEIIAGTGQEVTVDFATYFAVINQRSLEEAEGERLRKVGYYSEIFGGLSSDDVGEPVLVTNHTLVREMGVIGSFTEELTPVRYRVGANGNGDRWGKIELAFRELHIPDPNRPNPYLSETTVPLAIADEISYQHNDRENIVTDNVFKTILYIGRQGVQRWIDIKLPGVGDEYVTPLFKAMEESSIAIR